MKWKKMVVLSLFVAGTPLLAQDPNWEQEFQEELREDLSRPDAFDINASGQQRRDPSFTPDRTRSNRSWNDDRSTPQTHPIYLLGEGDFPFEVKLAMPRYYGDYCSHHHQPAVSRPLSYAGVIEWLRNDYGSGSLGQFYRQSSKGKLSVLSHSERPRFLIRKSASSQSNAAVEPEYLAELSEAMAVYLGASKTPVSVLRQALHPSGFYLRGDYGSRAHLTLALHEHRDSVNGASQIFLSGFMGRLVESHRQVEGPADQCWEGIAFESRPDWRIEGAQAVSAF